MLHLYVITRAFLVRRLGTDDERGQATVEYVLLMLGAAALALLVLAWATGTGKIGDLLDSVIDSITGQV